MTNMQLGLTKRIETVEKALQLAGHMSDRDKLHNAIQDRASVGKTIVT